MPTDPFTTLGFAQQYAIDKNALDKRYRELQQALHPDRHTAAPASTRALTLQKAVGVNEAYRILGDDLRRGEALLTLLGGQVTEQAADPEFLMEMLELREALTEARAAVDAAEVARLAALVEDKASVARTALTAAFAVLESRAARNERALLDAQHLLGRLRYYRRFQDEVSRFEDEVLTESV